MNLANFWRYIHKAIEPDDDLNYRLSFETRKFVHCLRHYPNDFWKYATSSFFAKNMNNVEFDSSFRLFLKELISFLFAEFIKKPTVNAIKDDIYSSCISLMSNNQLEYKIDYNREELKNEIDNHNSSRLSRALLLLDAYLNENQNELIPHTFDIEHIFPKKWQDTNYNGWNKEDALNYLDRLGNKIVLEKKLNIQAGNGYFGVKKGRYSKSKIAVVQELFKYPNNDWIKEDIEKREAELKDNILDFIEQNIKI